MFNYIKKLRKQPERKRRMVAIGTALVSTFVITGVWASATGFLGFGYTGSPQIAKYEKTPLSSISTQFGAAYVSLKDRFIDIKDKAIKDAPRSVDLTQTETSESGTSGHGAKVTHIIIK